MNRVRMLLLGLLALFFVSEANAYNLGLQGCADNVCRYLQIIVVDNNSSYTGSGNSTFYYWPGDSYPCNSSDRSAYTTSGPGYYTVTFTPYYWRVDASFPAGVWQQQGSISGEVRKGNGIDPSLNNSSPSALYPDGPPEGCSEVCDIADSDGDGVCNSCDKSPGTPDQQHCIWAQLVVAGTNEVAIMSIDESGQCNGSQLVDFKKQSILDQITAGTKKAFWDISSASRTPITSPTCQGDDGAGNCLCGYPTDPNSALADFVEGGDYQVSVGVRDELLKAASAVDDEKYDDCSSIKSRCETACISRGGVATNTCTASGDTTYAECKCKNEFAFDIATPTETSTDSNASGDPNVTGGADSNSDGVDDAYSAMKGALNDSALNSKLDSTNNHLNSIGNKIDGVGSAINGLGTALNGIGEGIGGLGSGIEGLGSKIDNLGSKLEDLKDGQNQDITATGDSPLPDVNTYDPVVEEVEESSLADAVTSYISNGLPILSYFKTSYVNVTSTNPVLSADIFGNTITVDFSQYTDFFHYMGVVLVFISSIIAFMIIVQRK